ncbi:hypothetical protein FOZ63_003752, partial [Perkinsus olseni]
LPDPTRTPAYHNTAAQQHSATPQKASGTNNKTIIVFDWDDTILPTTWLERQRLLQIGSIRIKPCHARALTALSDSVLSTIEIAANYGKLMIITNAAPGWVEASCQQFMPALLPFIKSVPLYARPFNALMTTWKLDAFARECGGGDVEGVVSLGDGPIERQACLRLMAEDKRVKSVKFKESPSISQLVSEHELLHLRLKDLLKHDSDLDLRLLCNNTNPQAGNGGRPPCSIVHISKLDKTATTASSSPPVTLPRIPQAASNNYTPLRSSMDKDYYGYNRRAGGSINDYYQGARRQSDSAYHQSRTRRLPPPTSMDGNPPGYGSPSRAYPPYGSTHTPPLRRRFSSHDARDDYDDYDHTGYHHGTHGRSIKCQARQQQPGISALDEIEHQHRLLS